MPRDTRRFIVAFALLWAAFLGEFVAVHLRLAPPPTAVLRHAGLDLDLRPGAGRARVSARLVIHTPTGADLSGVALVLPAAASGAEVRDASGRRLRARWLPGSRTYFAGRPAPGGREWRLQRYAQPRLDVSLRGRGGERVLSVEYALDAALLRGAASLGPGRAILPGGWFPRPEPAPGRGPAEFTYVLSVRAPAGERAVASGRLLERVRTEGGESSRWTSVRPAADVWVVSAPLEERVEERGGRRVSVYLPPGREPELAAQLAAQALDALGALEARAGARAETEWHLAALDRLGAISRARPPLVLLDAGVFRRAARRAGSRAERGAWIAEEVARAWVRPPPPDPEPQEAAVLAGALGAVVAQIAISGRAPGVSPAPDAGPGGWRQRVDRMMRCRAYAGDSASRPALGADGRPAAGLLGAAKLPATLDTLASQMGEARFLSLVTGEGEGTFLQRLRRSADGAALAPLLTSPWLADLSVEEAALEAGGVRVRVADRGEGPSALRVEVRLVAPDGSERVQWVRLAPGGSAEVRFAGVRAWSRIEIDPLRRIFQIEYANDALPREANPWAAVQRVWDARRWIARGEYPRAVEEARAAAALERSQGEAAYWVGFALVKMGRGAEAIEWLERARSSPLDSDVVAAEALYLLGQACEAAGDRARARDLYRRVVEEGWTSFSVERARRALADLETAPAGGAR